MGITWRSDEEGARAAAGEVAGHGVHAEARHLDLSDPASGAAVVGELAVALGGMDVLVNNAGTMGTAYVTGASFVIDGGLTLMAAQANALLS